MIDRFEEMIRRDPARRGLVESEEAFGPLCPGHLAHAAQSLADGATHVGLVTGFYVPHAEIPAAETDGPPGTALLAYTLQKLGIQTTIVTDQLCLPAVRAAIGAMQFEVAVVAAPHLPKEQESSSEWASEFLSNGHGKDLSHLISIERVGPSHTVDSLRQQVRTGNSPEKDFNARVLPSQQNCCHNMRGDSIDAHTADLHHLFDLLGPDHRRVTTIGIGDGANEIGMGSIPWEDLVSRLRGENVEHLPCRVATTWNIVAGTSNWGAYALAAAVAHLKGQPSVLEMWDQKRLLESLQQMVDAGPAVDGVTGKQTPTVDGLPYLTYIQPWLGIRRLLGLS